MSTMNSVLALALLITSTIALPWDLALHHPAPPSYQPNDAPAPYPTLKLSSSTQGVFETHPAGTGTAPVSPTGTGTGYAYPTGTSAPLPTGYMHKRWNLGPKPPSYQPQAMPMGTAPGTGVFPIPTGTGSGSSYQPASPFGFKDKQFNGGARKGDFKPYFPIDGPGHVAPEPTATTGLIPTGTGSSVPTGY